MIDEYKKYLEVNLQELTCWSWIRKFVVSKEPSLKMRIVKVGGLAQMVERSLSMREVPGSMPGSSIYYIERNDVDWTCQETIVCMSGWPSGLRRQTQEYSLFLRE